MFLGSVKGDGTLTIAVCFIVLAYILHPIVETAYHRIRAYYAWRAVERNESVEVTEYPMVAEVLWGRGKVDPARIVAFILLLFSISSWGLELQLGLVNITDGPVDMFDRPPPVVFRDGNAGPWEVLDGSDFTLTIPPRGYLSNFESVSDDEDSILEKGQASSIYRTHMNQVPIKGLIVIALWSTNSSESTSKLYYDEGNGRATVKNLGCTGDVDSPQKLFIGENSSWGLVTECDKGPKKPDHGDDDLQPPTIILQSADGDGYLIVEEEGSYPGFLYSVWSAEEEEDGNFTISHDFHIASRFRLVEAIITGIVLGVHTGGGCVDLMLQHSKVNFEYTLSGTRTQPFGERPGDNKPVRRLEEVEPITRGVYADGLAASCLFLLVGMIVVGIIWNLRLRSKTGIDVYDRDELIRAVTLTDRVDGERPPGLRMFVRKDEAGGIDVIITDTGKSDGWCGAFFKTPAVVAQDEPAVTPAEGDNGDNSIPPGARRVRLEGMRLGRGRTNFPRGFGPQSLSLRSSPISSTTCTPMDRTPAHQREVEVVQAQMFADGQKALKDVISAESSTRTIPADFSGRTTNLAPQLRPPRGEGFLRTSFSPARIPRPAPAGIAFTPTRRSTTARQRSLTFFPSLDNLSSRSRSEEAKSEDSDSDTTFSSVGST